MSVNTDTRSAGQHINITYPGRHTRAPALLDKLLKPLLTDPSRWPRLDPAEITSSDAAWRLRDRQREELERQRGRVMENLRRLRMVVQARQPIREALGPLQASLKSLQQAALDQGQEPLARIALRLRYVLMGEPLEDLDDEEWRGYFEASEELKHDVFEAVHSQACSQKLSRAGLNWVGGSDHGS